MHQKQLSILPAEPRHAEDFAHVQVVSWHAAYRGQVPDAFLDDMTVPSVAARFLEKLREENCPEMYIAYLGKTPVGRLVIGPSRDEDAPPDEGEAYAVYLVPKVWGKGYGRQLMAFAVRRLREMGFGIITVWVLAANTRAQNFYTRCGFAADGARKDVALGGVPLPCLRYTLADKNFGLPEQA